MVVHVLDQDHGLASYQLSVNDHGYHSHAEKASNIAGILAAIQGSVPVP
jgi:hypothetical protein